MGIKNTIPRLMLKNMFILSSALKQKENCFTCRSLKDLDHAYVILKELIGAIVLIWEHYQIIEYYLSIKMVKIKNMPNFSRLNAQTLRFCALLLSLLIFLWHSMIVTKKSIWVLGISQEHFLLGIDGIYQ